MVCLGFEPDWVIRVMEIMILNYFGMTVDKSFQVSLVLTNRFEGRYQPLVFTDEVRQSFRIRRITQ